MKTRIVTIFLLIIILIALLLHNRDNILNIGLQSKAVIPLKETYSGVFDSISDWSDEYLNQSSSIEKYRQENAELKLQLANQLNYIDESKKLYKVFPTLKKIKLNDNIDVVQTLSYVKFNNFSQIVLSKPKDIEDKRIYGLIQNGVVGGVAKVENGQLFGYLANNEKSRFSIFIGEKRVPGIAIGSGQKYATIQFIPKWFDIKAGDKVITSGLDGIFYGNIPVGVVNQVELQGNFKTAQMDLYCDLYHPDVYYLVKNIKPVLLNSYLVNYNNTLTPLEQKQQIAQGDANETIPSSSKPSVLSSTPTVEIDQTKEYEIDTTKPINQEDSTNINKKKSPPIKDTTGDESSRQKKSPTQNESSNPNITPVDNLEILNQ